MSCRDDRPGPPLRRQLRAEQRETAVTAEQLKGAIDKLATVDYAARTAAARTIRRAPVQTAVSRAARGRRRQRGRLRPVPLARPAVRVQRSAYARRHGAVAHGDQRSPASDGLRLLRAQRRRADPAAAARCASARGVRVRASRADPCARRIRHRRQSSRRAEWSGDERAGLLPQRGSSRRWAITRPPTPAGAHDHGQAGWSAAGRCGPRHRQDWRQAIARDARGPAAHRAARTCSRRSRPASACSV